MSSIVKALSQEIALTAANTVSNASVVRIYAAAAGAVITVKDGSAVTTGIITLPAGVTYIKKDPDGTVAASTSVQASSVAHYT